MADWEEAALVARQLWAEWRVDAADRKPYQRWQFRRYYGSQESLADWEAASRLPSGDRRSAPSEDRCDEDLPPTSFARMWDVGPDAPLAAKAYRRRWAELRVDSSDGKSYGRWEFARHYGVPEYLRVWEVADDRDLSGEEVIAHYAVNPGTGMPLRVRPRTEYVYGLIS